MSRIWLAIRIMMIRCVPSISRCRFLDVFYMEFETVPADFKQIPFETPTYIYPPPRKLTYPLKNHWLVQMYSQPKLVPLSGGHSFVFRGVNNQQLTCLPMFQLIKLHLSPWIIHLSASWLNLQKSHKNHRVEYVGNPSKSKRYMEAQI